MDRDAFEDHLDLYGGDLARWPADVRSSAEALMRGSPAAAEALRALREAETYLRSTAPRSSGMGDAIAARATCHRQMSGREASTRRLAAGTGWSVAAAVVLILGYTIGDVAPVPHDESPDRVMASALDTTGVYDVD